MARKLQIKRGQKKDMPQLAEGELGFALDEEAVYIGTGTKNVPISALGGVVVNNSAPDNREVLWIDTSNGGVAKYNNGTEWVLVPSVWG